MSEPSAPAKEKPSKPVPVFVPTGKLGVQIVLGLALVILVVEAILMLLIALAIPAEGPNPGKDPHGLPSIDTRGSGHASSHSRPGEIIGDLDTVPAADAPGEAAPVTVASGAVERLAADRLRVALDLVCESGCRVESARPEVRLGAAGCIVEAVEFHGPPGSWQATDTGAIVHLTVTRGVWIHSAGGWAIDVTLRIPSDSAGDLPMTVTVQNVRPATLRMQPASLTIPVPPVQ